MVNVYGTLGFTPGKFLVSLRSRADVQAVKVFHDRHERSLEAAQIVRDHCHDVGIPLETVAVDAFDIIDCATEVQRALRSTEARATVFNIAGGTKVLSSGAVLACILEGVPAVSVDERTGLEIPLPLVEVPYGDLLGDKRRRVLRYIAEHPGCSQTEVREALRLTKPTISHHVARLVASGLVEETRHASDGRRKVLQIIPSAKLLLPDEEDP